MGGPLAVLEMEVAWPSLAAAAKAGRAAVWSVEAELLPSADWLLLGLHRQSFRIELWQLLALTAGYVPLPALTLRKLPDAAEPPSVSERASTELPMPAYLMGSTARGPKGGGGGRGRARAVCRDRVSGAQTS